MSLNDNSYKNIFYTLFFVVLLSLFYSANSMSISYGEALNVFKNTSLLTILTNSSIYIFGQNDIALRLPFILFYLLCLLLMFYLSKDFFKKQSDRYISLSIFMILPGLISASLLVNSAIVVTFLVLLYVLYYQKLKKHSYALLVLFLFVDNSFAILYLALFFFSLRHKDKKLLIISLVLFVISMSIYGFDSSGKPRGFLVDTFAIYATIFSPLLFIYFFYTVYRSGIKRERGLIWYIATTSLIFSFILSFRQRINIEDYAPYVVIFLPYMVRTFLHTIRVRLPQFRNKYYIISSLVLIVLFTNLFFTIVNKPLYMLVEDPKKHFIYKYDYAKQLALNLKENNINNIYTDDEKLSLRLKFYNINSGDEFYLTTKDLKIYDYKFDIKYYGKIIYTAYIIKKI
jgi:hypothetical protein